MARPWSDLPQPLVGLIINKLDFPDQVSALMVCKHWLIKEYVTSLDCLPWVVRYKTLADYSFKCELTDPHSQQVFKAPNPISLEPYGSAQPLASKQGWLLFSLGNDSDKLLLYNAFTNDIRWIDKWDKCYSMWATINVDPKSRDFEIFMFSVRAGYLHIDTYTRGGLTKESIVKMGEFERFHCVLYMKDTIYCLHLSGKLYSYSLIDPSWTLLTSKLPESLVTTGFYARSCWLLEREENLMLVIMDYAFDARGENHWMIFRFDRSGMSWVVETGLKSCAIYISRKTAISVPFVNRSGEKLEGCRLFYIDDFSTEIGCYSLSEGTWTKIQPDEYSWMKMSGISGYGFIEPPYFVTL